MKPLVINDEAADELDEAIRYYENKRPGIGVNFSDRVSEAFHRIQRNPQLYPFHKDTRVQKCLIKRFPYTVFYLELDDREKPIFYFLFAICYFLFGIGHLEVT